MYLPETKAIFAFFEMIALAFAFGGAERLLDGKSLLSVVGAWLAAVAFFVAGIKGSWLRSKIAASGILANVPKFYRDSRFWLGGDRSFLFQKSRDTIGLLFVLFGAERMAQFVADREIQKLIKRDMPPSEQFDLSFRLRHKQNLFKKCLAHFQVTESGTVWVQMKIGKN